MPVISSRVMIAAKAIALEAAQIVTRIGTMSSENGIRINATGDKK